MRSKTMELQYLETLTKRTQLNKQEHTRLTALQKGFSGECGLDNSLQQASISAAAIINDLTIKYHGNTTQIDQLFSHGHKLYLVDAKNYSGSYTFAQNSWSHNNKKLPRNIFSQIDRARDILACILEEAAIDWPIETVVVFTDPTVELNIEDPINHIVKRLGAFTDFVSALGKSPLNGTDLAWQTALRKYQIPSHQLTDDFSQQIGHRQLQLGIRCLKCSSFNWQQDTFWITCKNCGAVKVKEEAYVRTICDYGVLFFNQGLRLQDLCRFFGDGYGKRYISLELKKHFSCHVVPGKARVYCNRGLNFKYWFAEQSEYFQKIQQRLNWRK